MMATFPSRRGPTDLPANRRMGKGAPSVDAAETALVPLVGGDSWCPRASIRSRARSDMITPYLVCYVIGGSAKRHEWTKVGKKE